ncbi:hypothetical protein TRIATDRAFT_10221, partial [Trichoderma atroviride IMI 206040]
VFHIIVICTNTDDRHREIYSARTSIPHTAPKQARDRATYASFGDDGTTATANAHGHLLQITRYFGNKPSGFFCVDLPLAPEPCVIEARMNYLQESCQDATRGIRLFFDDSENSARWRAKTGIDAMPKMAFLQDRWPSFTTQTSAFYLNIQYVISQGTVYQIYTYTLKEEKLSTPPQVPVLKIDANLLLRNLNFIEDGDENERESDDAHYTHFILNDGYSVATMHKVRLNAPQNQDAVALFTSLFINGRLQTFDDSESGDESEDLYAKLDQQALTDLIEQGFLKVTLAYKLDIVSSSKVKKASAFSRGDLLAAELILKTPYERMLFSEDEHLNFILRRNLEHILSVCSIPVEDFEENEVFSAPSDSPYCKAIALTCGDVSGHRIATTASFYAFQFLLNALKFFQKKGLTCACPAGINLCEDYACKMYSRIRFTCRGHLRWLHYAHISASESPHSPSYWATGETIPVWESKIDEISITTTLCNLIKAAGLCQLIADENTRHEVAKDFGDMAICLINSLHHHNKNNEYIFPRFKKRTPHTFYASDHAIIWWAIKSTEELGLASICYIPPDIGQRGMSYSSTKIQKSMLMKLAAENPDGRRSMLTTSRNLSEDRFRLGVNDTILFHAMEVGLFNKPNSVDDTSNFWKNKVDVWKNIVDCQGDQDPVLSDPLELALVLILSANNKCINSRPAREVYDSTKSFLFTISSPNGLFPGQLDENQEPALFGNETSRDSYWHVTFELPYILWNYQKQRPISQCPLTAEIIADQRFSELFQRMEKTIGRIEAMAASPTATRSVNEIPNEWLYDEPNFFKFHHDVSSDSIVQFCENNKNKHYGIVIDEAMLIVQNENNYDVFKDDIAGYIVDVPRSKGLYSKTRTFNLQKVTKSENFGSCIQEQRTPAISKKRLFHFYPLSLNVALASFVASSEKDAIALFFDRHASYDRYFSETTTLAHNKWTTELHLPFYQISNQEPSSGKYRTVAKMVGIPFLRNNGSEENTIWINRATMSFRFDGDIFDRYWTCHFIEYSPRIIYEGQKNTYKGEQNPSSILTRRIDDASKESSWRQRRILELILFDLMLEEMLRSTKEILMEIRSRIERSFESEAITGLNDKASKSMLLDPLNLIDKVDNNIFLSTSTLWNELEPIFQLMKDLLHENLETIANWTDREKNRGLDEPHWTLNDERSYRRAISALQASNQRRVDELKRYNADIASFNASFARKLEVMRSELDRRGADDIRLFTYVTVVFLPVGFATSVFSMNGSPSGDTLHGMIILAILALLITFIALVNARILDRVLGPLFGACRVITEGIVNPLINELHKLAQPIGKSVYLLI